MPARNKIIWQYWQNPYVDMHENEYVPEEEAKIPLPWDDQPQEIKVRPVVVTPMGLMPVQPFQNLTTRYQFWLGHTNFDINREVATKIEQCEGVELLDILSRYCFRIASGLAFDNGSVRTNIQRLLNAMPPQQGEINPNNIQLDVDMTTKIQMLKEHLKNKQFPFWAIYVLPNGEIDYVGTEHKLEYEKRISQYKEGMETVGGVMYEYS